MEWRHESEPGRLVRLGYGLNLHAPETLEQLLAGLASITVPLRERLGVTRDFGVGMYLPAALARTLARDDALRARLADFLDEHALDPFTYNAFPFGGFQADGLKERVFEPRWNARARLDYTLDVARVALALARRRDEPLAISTHTGGFGPLAAGSDEEGAVAAGLARCALEFAQLHESTGVELLLALEPEPRANCGDLVELAAFRARLLERAERFLVREHGLARARAVALLERHLGTCLDACHAAVEFEDPATLDWPGRLGKLQFTSALRVVDPASNAAGRAALLALDEPRFLHQVTGRHAAGLARARDLGELGQLLQQGGDAAAPWLACDEWRCHFHVPVDLEDAGRASGLATTHSAAAALLARLLAEPRRWNGSSLHVEIETYTWEVLPGFARGASGLVDGLEREYRHLAALLTAAGWRPAASSPRG